MSIYKKLLDIQSKGVRADKDGKNPHFKSNYVTLDNLLGVILPLATEHKLTITNYVHENSLITKIMDTESGEMIISSFPIYSEDPQKIGSTITYAKRYNLGSIFNLITEVDDDGNFASGVAEKEKPWFNDFEKMKEEMRQKVISWERTPAEIIENLEKKYRVSNQTKALINNLF